MRYISLLLLVPSLISGIVQLPVSAAEEALPNEVLRSQEFWPQARQLTQEQILLTNRIEQALIEPDPNQVRALRGQLTLHSAAVERFLKNQYPIPKLLCNAPNAPTTTEGGFAISSGLSQQQAVVYCNLAAAAEKLDAFAPLLERRLFMLASVAEVKPLRVVGERQAPALPVNPTQSPNLGRPALSRYNSAQPQPAAEPPVIGRPMKMAIADYTPPTQPAIALPPEAAPALQSLKQLLASTQATFPTGVSFLTPQPVAPIRDRNTYGLYPEESQIYAKALAQPNTGIARVLLAEADQPNPGVLGNRLEPTVVERFPFVPLLQTANSATAFVPRLLLEINQGQMQLVQSGLNYGFVAPIGDVPLEELQTTLPAKQVNLSPAMRQFFLTYQPPQQLEAIQVDRRRFLTGKVNQFALPTPLSSRVPVQLGQTYLVRSLQFNLPEVVTTGEPISRRDRRYLDQLLEMQSHDVLVAVRPVSRRADGSYTVLWRLIQQFPNPQIQDLDQYVNLSNLNS